MSTSDSLANTLFATLTAGVGLTLPTPDLASAPYQVPAATGPAYDGFSRLTNADLTSGEIGGAGTFDVMMGAYRKHLEKEFTNNRISGAEYSKAYTALAEQAMGSAVQFLLGRDTAYWQAVNTQLQAQVLQVQAVTARVDLETAKARLAAQRFEALVSEANYALIKLKLATENATYDAAAFQVSDILPNQKKLVIEQGEAARAQTLDMRSDGAPVTGSVGKQKALYDQQITAYKRDSETKAAKMFLDSFITMKTVDEGLPIPLNFVGGNIDRVFNKIRLELDMLADNGPILGA